MKWNSVWVGKNKKTDSWQADTVKVQNIQTPKKFDLIVWKCVRCDFTIEQWVEKMPTEWQTV